VRTGALGGQGVILKSRIGVVAALVATQLRQNMRGRESERAPIYVLMRSRRHLSTKSRASADAVSA
jgi:hypothetical protein